jgi:hypothetical protein
MTFKEFINSELFTEAGPLNRVDRDHARALNKVSKPIFQGSKVGPALLHVLIVANEAHLEPIMNQKPPVLISGVMNVVGVMGRG